MPSNLLLLGGGKGAVTGNLPPTLDSIADPSPVAENAAEQTISLAGITAGGAESQTLTVTATSTDTDVVPNPTVNYTSPDATGTLTYTPAGDGTATVTVTVSDGSGTTARTFGVVVTPVFSDSFTGIAFGEISGRSMPVGGKAWTGSGLLGNDEDPADIVLFHTDVSGDAYALADSGMIGDGTIAVTVTTVPLAGGNVYFLGVVGRTPNNGTFDNGGYYACFHSTGAAETVELYLLQDNGDGSFDLDAGHKLGTAAYTGNGADIDLQLVMSGSSIKVYADGVQKISVTNATWSNTRQGGGIFGRGISSMLNNAFVDDFFAQP